MKTLKIRLDAEVALRNCTEELCESKPDPLMIAREVGDEYHALTCALFAYGNVRAIVELLRSFDARWIDESEEEILRATQGHYYRFQNREDIAQWFITLGRLKRNGGVEERFKQGYERGGVLEGLSHLIDTLYDLNSYRSTGYTFLIGKPIKKISGTSAMKRWMMYLRWMVRHDTLDMGVWSCVCPSELIMPLDTHTFSVSKRLGLLQRNQCDLKAALELTETLRGFDPIDPIKYDFALYRLGQEKKG
ncbi:MAG: TIGR02757 family protein [Campylobacterales bacterium]|nr:TIGR02757 family protein [Campylobacterales bacterium]